MKKKNVKVKKKLQKDNTNLNHIFLFYHVYAMA